MQFRKNGPMVDFSQTQWLFSNREKETCQERSSFRVVYIMLEDATCTTIYAVSRHNNWGLGFIIMIQVFSHLDNSPSTHAFHLLKIARCAEPLGCLRLHHDQPQRQSRF